jgi:hypothetical protein
VDQHRETGRALDQGADGGPFQADEQVAFPVARDRSVFDLGGSLADQHVVGDVVPGSASDSSPRDPPGTAGAETGDQLALERAASLDVEGW